MLPHGCCDPWREVPKPGLKSHRLALHRLALAPVVYLPERLLQLPRCGWVAGGLSSSDRGIANPRLAGTWQRHGAGETRAVFLAAVFICK